MTEYASISEFLRKNSVDYAIVRLLKGLIVHLDYMISIKADVEKGQCFLKMPLRYHFQFVDSMLRQFTYKGYSFDEIVIVPMYTNTNKTCEACNVEVRITTKPDFNDNLMKIKYKR